MGVLTFFESHKNFCWPKAPTIETLHFHIILVALIKPSGLYSGNRLVGTNNCHATWLGLMVRVEMVIHRKNFVVASLYTYITDRKIHNWWEKVRD